MTPATRKPKSFESFMASYVEELKAMSDEEILDGDDPAIWQEKGRQILEAAKRIVANRDSLSVRGGATNPQPTSRVVDQTVSVSDARAYLLQAANDPRFTLAARGLEDMSDEEVLRLYRQLRQLEQSDEDSPEMNR